MNTNIWQPKSDAPEGWRLVGYAERWRSTWLTNEDELVFVPVQMEPCDKCWWEGEIESDDATDEWRRCPDCDGLGFVEGSEEYDFEWAVNKSATLKVEKLSASNKDITKWEWWEETQS